MPPHPSLRGVFILCLLTISCRVLAQKEIVLSADGATDSISVTGRSGEVIDAPEVLRAEWLKIDGGATRFNVIPTAGAGHDQALHLDELIVAGVEQYLDQRIHFTKTRVNVDLSVPRMVDGINRMIAASSAHFGVAPVVLSDATRQQLGRVSGIDWSKATFGVDGGDDQEKYLAIYYYVRAQRQELERQLRADLNPLSSVNVLGNIASVPIEPGRTDSVPTVCNTVFDDQNFLCPLDLKPDSGATTPDVKLTDALLANITANAREVEFHTIDQPKLRKRDRWLKAELDAINGRIDKMDQRKELWALRDRMDAVEGRIDDLGAQVAELKTDRQRPEGSDNPVANLSNLTGRNITIHFASGSAEVAASDRQLLQEVAREMGRSPQDRALITGYADPSGNPSVNIELSERRAKSVRAFLLGLGISADRLLINYYGAGRGTGPDASERRVEIEWLPQ